MAAAKRVIWTKSENTQVAGVVYRRLKSLDGGYQHNRDVQCSAVWLDQKVALSDCSRHKSQVSESVCATVSSLVQEMSNKDCLQSHSTERKSPRVPDPMVVAALNRPVTIDIQIRSLVRAELLSHQPALLSRIEGLLCSHERIVRDLIERSEARLMQFWGGNSPTPDSEAKPIVVEPQRPKKFRVLVACLRSDQHHLIQDRLKAVEDRVEVVVLDQDNGFVGVKREYYDKVLVLSKFISHSHFAKIQSIFSKNQIVVKTGAALTAATVIMAMLDEVTAT